METTIKVNKSEYEVFSYMSGYFGICKIGSHGANPILGGDSANEDDYNEDYINDMHDQWDGSLTHCGNDEYGENGFTING